jgi:sec-independent protein translocase protein TatB
MPVAIRSVAAMVKRARKMAGEFQTHVDEMVREANLDGVKDTLDSIRNFDIKSEIERAVDADGTIRDAFSGNPLEPAATPAAPPAETRRWTPPAPPPPAFIPPQIAVPAVPPSFIPPDAVRH